MANNLGGNRNGMGDYMNRVNLRFAGLESRMIQVLQFK